MKAEDYVEGARAIGLPDRWILIRYILPNVLPQVLVQATLTIAAAIIAEASLSFLGLGPRTDIPDWGQLLAMGQPYIASAWWISTFPGVVLTLTVIAVSLAGDWLRDKLDVE